MMQLRGSTIPKWLLLVGIGAAITFTVLAQLPLKWFQGTVSRNTQCKILLSDPMGSLWQGSTAIGFSEPAIDGKSCRPALAITERVQWTTDCSLWRFSCNVRIETPALFKPLQVEIRPSRVVLQDNEIRLPAEILEVIGAPWTLLHPRADLGIRWNNLVFSEGKNTGSLRATLSDLSSPISQIKPLGSYEIQATLMDDGLDYTLTTTKGPLLLNAQGTLGSSASGQGQATATPEMQEALTGLLNLIGRRQGDVYKLAF